MHVIEFLKDYYNMSYDEYSIKVKINKLTLRRYLNEGIPKSRVKEVAALIGVNEKWLNLDINTYNANLLLSELSQVESDSYDCLKDILIHKNKVSVILNKVIDELNIRKYLHDNSKMYTPEKEIFDVYTEKLRSVPFESSEYKAYRKQMKKALDHHYMVNRHHPEHFENGIKDMTLIDLIEMIIDWTAAATVSKDDSILRSIELGQFRFNYGVELKQLLENTANYFVEEYGLTKEKLNEI